MRILITIALIFAFSGFQSCANNPENSSDTSAIQTPEPAKKMPETDWKTQDDPLYTIDYPSNWEMTYTGQQGISLVAISPKDPNSDKFRENVTLIVQDLKGKETDLETFVDGNTQQIRDMITNSKLVENKEADNGTGTYREVQYTGEQGTYTLLYTQRFYIHNGYAFVISFTCPQKDYASLSPLGTKFLDSLHLK